MNYHNSGSNTLTSIPQSKFSDSNSPSPPSSPIPTPLSLPADQTDAHKLIPIPSRRHPDITFAWVNQTDRMGPGPNTPTQFTKPTPENYPINIWTPPPTVLSNNEKHWLSRARQWSFFNKNKLWDLIVGTKPVILCGGTNNFLTACKICRRRIEKLHIGGEAAIGGGWGKGVIMEIIRQEKDHVVVWIEGPHVHTKSGKAKARIPIKMFHLPRGVKLHRYYLNIRGHLPDAPSAPTAKADRNTETRVTGGGEAWWNTESQQYPPTSVSQTSTI